MKTLFNKERWKAQLERAGFFWERHGFAVVLLFCAGIIGLTAALSGLYQRSEDADEIGKRESPVPSYTAEAVLKDAYPAGANTAPPTEEEIQRLDWPVKGEVHRAYNAHSLALDPTLGEYRAHAAIDIAAETGSVILCPLDAVVKSAEMDDLYGYTILLWHEKEGVYTGYASLEGIGGIQAGDRLRKGEKIGTVGASAIVEDAQGAHLHFYTLDESLRPIDPLSLLQMEN